MSAETRARILEQTATLLDQRVAHFIALLQREGGKTLDDALSEVREAIDFCRYYAAEGRKQFGEGTAMPGPTGECNVLRLRGRGVSSPSRRGISRWRSFSVRSRRP
jgi:RHH-type proline utilization regulon transcriptional repressor/proline dehydrogenase/delta 1-pyrroline-5-carboxylate dehydrogenase